VTLRVRKSSNAERTVFFLSGRIESRHLPQLRELLEVDVHLGNVSLDLGEIRLVDMEAVAFLAACETAGIGLNNCPAYVRVWIDDAKKDNSNEA
jgi:ABC-type transporter Mla MlaB component